MRTFDHLVGTGFLWLARIRGEPSPLAVWPALTAAERAERSRELARRWQHLLEELDPEDLARVVSYRNTKGEAWESTVGSILTHVLLHSAHHRGQIASALREAGHAPPLVDYIHAVRGGYLDEPGGARTAS